MSRRAAKPADTTIMGTVHDALRRDLTRLESALDDAAIHHVARRQAIADHIQWMTSFLDSHHRGEDLGLWPLLRERAPQAHALLDRMEADHARIGPAVNQLLAATARYRSDIGKRARAELREAVRDLSEVLLPHLRAEEDEAMPLASTTLTEADWRSWDRKHNVKGKSLGRLAAEGHWLMDGLDPVRYDKLIHVVPAPVRIVIIKGYARRYRAECARRWGPGIPVGPAADASPGEGGVALARSGDSQ